MKYSILDNFFFKGFRAVEDVKTPQVEYRTSALLVSDTRKLNNKLNDLFDLSTLDDIDVTIINKKILTAFKLAEGSTETKIKTSEVVFDGSVGYVGVDGCIGVSTVHVDLSLFQEDLIMAFYKSRGGTFGVHKDFLDFINKGIKETPYSKFTEI